MTWFRKKKTYPGQLPNNGLSSSPGEPVAGLLSDPGCCRDSNEDCVRMVRAGFNGHADRGLLLIVADGMGGHQSGEVASRTAVEMIGNEYHRLRGTPGEALEKAFYRAHLTILKLAKENPTMAGMGTTCTALVIAGRQAWAAHVGDSRLYLVRDEKIYQLSEDHTQCMEMVRKGLMSLEEARQHEDRGVLIHAMGTRLDLKLMTWPKPMMVKPRDVFVLCTDGLHDLVSDDEIRKVVQDMEPSIACSRLIQSARDRGGHDNISLAVAAVPSTDINSAALKNTRPFEVKI